MLAEFLAYTALADERIIDAFNKNEVNGTEAQRLFSHVLNAQHIWANRILGLPVLFDVWQEHDPKQFMDLSSRNIELIQICISDKNQNEIISYKNSVGQIFQNTVGEMLLHLFNHSTYHRGQIVTLLKNDGVSPPATDYILFKRNNLL